MRAHLFLAAKALVSLLLIGFVAWRIDLARLADTLARVDLPLLALAGLLLLPQPFIGTLRWKVIVAAMGGGLPFRAALRLTFIATFFNQVLPGAVVGDGMRIWLAQRQGLSWRRAVHSVAADRLLMLVLLLVLVLVGESWLSSRLGYAAVPWLLPAALVAGALGLAFLLAARRMPPGWLHRRLLRWLHDLAEDMRLLLFRPRPALKLLATSLLAYLCLGVTLWILGLAVGAPIPASAYLLVGPPLILASVLPISVGGWGVREAAALALFTAVGADPAQAVAISVLFGLVSLLVGTPGLVVWLLARAGLTREAAEAGAQGPR